MASISCGSSASTNKSTKCESENRAKSTDTNCTSNSSCFFKRRKPMNPLAYSILKPAQHKPNPVKQRVMSAKMIKLRQLQSQLNDANYHLSEVSRENQTLKTLQKRQEKAISKYENTNADLPRLIRAHEEEIRNLTERNKSLKKKTQELTDQLKLKDEELTRVKEHLNRLEKLDKDKHLTEREKLLDKVEDLKIKLQKSEEQITTLNRKLILETKISKQRLNAELVKQKQQQKELMQALNEIDRLTNMLDGQDNVVRPKKAFSQFGRHSFSMVHLATNNHTKRILSSDKLKTGLQNPVSEVKLEPIRVKKDEHFAKNETFMIPMENIKHRLSNGMADHIELTTNVHKSRPSSSIRLEKLPDSVNQNIKVETTEQNEIDEKNEEPSNEKETKNSRGIQEFDFYNNKYSDGSSDERDVDTKSNLENIQKTDSLESFELNEKVLETQNKESSENLYETTKSSDSEGSINTKRGISKKDNSNSYNSNFCSTKNNNTKPNKVRERPKQKSSDSNLSSSGEETVEKFSALDKAIKRATENSREEFDKKLGEYCSEVVTSVKTCSKVIDMHKQSLKHSKQDTDTLIEAFKNTEKIESKLKQSFFSLDDEDMGLVNEILNEEFKFKNDAENKNKTNKKKETLVNTENKRKLLATLRAIDNGDSVDSLEEKATNKPEAIKEIFGGISN